MPMLPSGATLAIGLSSNPVALVGGSVWPMAAALCTHLLKHHRHIFAAPGRSTIEIGSGTGTVGLFAAGLGARCILSDQRPARAAAQPVSYAPDGASSIDLNELAGVSDCLLDLMRSNVARNEASFAVRPLVIELDYTDSAHVGSAARASPGARGFSLLLGADITYSMNQHAPLARAIARLLSKEEQGEGEGGALALIAHETRRSLTGTDVQLESFVAAAAAAGLTCDVSPLPVPDAGSSGSLVELRWASRARGACQIR